MEAMLGFGGETIGVGDYDYNGDQEKPSSPSASTSYGYKLVPWLNWDEWQSVQDSLFSDSPGKIDFSLKRISTWRSRGCLPVVIDVTASIIEIQQKDPFFRKDLQADAINSEQMLAMLYCMAILRLVNCVVEKTRRKTEVSIAEAAGAIGIPRTLIDIRHEGSHRDLPALQLVRDSAVKAMHWLKSYYWEPQMEQIPFQANGTVRIRKEIKSKLRELASCLKVKQSSQSGPSLTKGKSGKQREQFCGRSKFLSLMASKSRLSKSGGSKKQMNKAVKRLVSLYSSFSSDFLSVLLEILLKILKSSNLLELLKDYQVGQDICTPLHEWRLVITKISNKEPELLLGLLKAVLDMIETQQVVKHELGASLMSSEFMATTGQIEQLSYLFGWLVGEVRGLKPLCLEDGIAEIKVSSAGIGMSNEIQMDVLRKCLLLSSHGNKHLMDSALYLARVLGDSILIERLHKLSSLCSSDSDVMEENYSLSNTSSLLMQQDEFICQATKKLKLVKAYQRKSKSIEAADGNIASSGRWVMQESWNPCPIGMLPRDLGSSGRLPVLDHADIDDARSAHSIKRKRISEPEHRSDTTTPSQEIRLSDVRSLEEKNGKREGSSDIYASSVKKMRETVDGSESDGGDVVSLRGIEGFLMVDGVWKQVKEEEILAIGSGVRILV